MRLQQELKKKEYDWMEQVSLFCLGLYLAYLILNTTFFDFFSVLPKRTEDFLLYILTVATAMRILVRTISLQEAHHQWNHLLVSSVIVSLLWFVAYLKTGYRFLVFLSELIIGTIGVDYKKILKVYAFTVGTILGAAILAALGGGITNLVYLHEEQVRSAWGINYPTDFASYFVFLCLAAWVAWDDYPDYYFLLPCFLSLLIIKKVTASTTSVICMLLIIACMVWHMGTKNIHNHAIHKIRDVLEKLSCYSFPVFGLVMVLSMIGYYERFPWAMSFDIWSHNRLCYAAERFGLVGVQLFGKAFSQIGAGDTNLQVAGYNFIDCSYLLMILRYGLVFFVVISVLWVLMAKKGYKNGDRRLVLSMFIITIHALSEHHFVELNYNIFLILPFAVMSCKFVPFKVKKTGNYKGKEFFLELISGAIIVSFMTLIYKEALNWFRTLCTLTGVGNTATQRLFLFIVCSGMIISVAFFWRLLFQLMSAVCYKAHVKRCYLVFAVLEILIAIMVINRGNSRIYRAEDENQHVLDADAEAISLIKNQDGWRFYVDDLPLLYERRFGAFCTDLFHGDDLARQDNTAILTDIQNNSMIFFEKDFRYTPISNYHAIYTNSESLINKMNEAGYHFSAYYNQTVELDLNVLSALNNAPMSDDGILLNTAHPLTRCPDIDLYAETYEIEFDLLLRDVPSRFSEYPICDIMITGRDGRDILAEYNIARKDFNPEGQLHYKACCSINSTAVDFQLYPISNVELILTGISYRAIVPDTINTGEISEITKQDDISKESVEVESAGEQADDSGTVIRKGILTIGTQQHYLDEGGIVKTGWIQVPESSGNPEKWYYADESGVLATKWKEIGGLWYYFDEDLGMYQGSRMIGDKVYLFKESGVLADKSGGDGWQCYQEDGFTNYQYTNPDGSIVTGWKEIDGQQYYFDEQGWMCFQSVEIINGKRYLFLKSGTLASEGWQKFIYNDGDYQYYYTNPDGTIVTGWKEIDGHQYYFDDSGIMYWNGPNEVDGKYYFFDTSGALAKEAGWQSLTGFRDGVERTDWFYTNANGTMVEEGWREIGEKKYYFDSQGHLYADGTYYIDGNEYSFDENGVWQEESSLINVDGKSRFKNSDGSYARTCWKQVGSKYYYFDTDCNMKYGWVESNNKWYYCNPAMVTSDVIKIEGQYYYFDKTGALRTDRGWVSITIREANGFTQTHWFYIKENDGRLANDEWIKDSSNGEWHYMLPDMAKDTWVTFGNCAYRINSEGAWTGEQDQERNLNDKYKTSEKAAGV